MPDQAASDKILDLANALLDVVGNVLLYQRGSIEQAHAHEAEDLPRWVLEWENEAVIETVFGGGEIAYECELDLVFTAHADGDGANKKVDAMRLETIQAFAGDAKLDGNVRRVTFAGAERELDDLGRAVTGSIRVHFKVKYDMDANGLLA